MPRISDQEFNKYYTVIDDAQGEGLGDLITGLTGAVNLVKDNLPLITNTASAVGSVAGASKNIYDAAKSYNDYKKMKNFNSTLNILKEIKALKGQAESKPAINNTPSLDQNIKNDFANLVKGGKGLIKF